MNPDSLRAAFRPHDWDDGSKYAVAWLRDHVGIPYADAWEAQLRASEEGRALAEALVLSHEGHIEKLLDDNAALRDALQRIVVAAQALMVEWTMEEDGVPTTETHAEDALADAVAALPSVNWASKGPCWAGGNIAGD